MIGRVNTGGGTGGTLTVTTPGAGITVTASKDGKTKKKVSGADGTAVFKGLEGGTWTITMTDGSQTAQKTVAVTTDYNIVISFNVIPEFTYTGDFEVVNDSDEPITTSQDNWKIRFLTSGTLTFTDLNGAENGIDVFLVGGGGGAAGDVTGNYAGGGGGGGYTTTQKGIPVEIGTTYSVSIGSGGSGGYRSGSTGGNTSFANISASGGKGGSKHGGDGGSGGGSGGSGYTGGLGGTNGSDGGSDSSGYNGGKGQGTTTGEFGDSSATKYSNGGHGLSRGGSAGGNNTGNGGSAAGIGSSSGYNGGSGIVIIRNAREVS